jgi:DNA polymerase III alpha subunit
MLYLTLEDPSGMLDVIIFPDLYRRTRNVFSSSSPLLVTGTVEVDDDYHEPYLRAEKVELLT